VYGVFAPVTDASGTLIRALMDPTVLLILGGFTIASALHKYHLDRRLAVIVLKQAGNNAKLFLLVCVRLVTVHTCSSVFM